MKNHIKIIISALSLLVVILLTICIFVDKKYDKNTYNPFVVSTSPSQASSTLTLTCEFSESSGFYKEKENNYIKHVSGGDKNGKSTVLTFLNINSDKPQLDSNVKLKSGEEMVDDLIVLNRSSTSILFADRIPGGNPSFYTIFPEQKVAVWQQADSFPVPEPHQLVSSFDSMGFCH